MNRTAVAIICAPLIVPLLIAAYAYSLHLPRALLVVAVEIGVVAAYAGTLILGLPAYRLLIAWRLTSGWFAPVLGFLIGGFMWLAFGILFSLMLGESIELALTSIGTRPMLEGILWPGGVSGAATGVLFWLIARPKSEWDCKGELLCSDIEISEPTQTL